VFKGIKLSTFMSTPEEWHALIIGFCEVICPWPQQHPTITAELNAVLWDEHHYYVLGRVLGVLAWLGIAAAVKELFF
jgi:hypothetical protein